MRETLKRHLVLARMQKFASAAGENAEAIKLDERLVVSSIKLR
jgi:hypothetical protein